MRHCWEDFLPLIASMLFNWQCCNVLPNVCEVDCMLFLLLTYQTDSLVSYDVIVRCRIPRPLPSQVVCNQSMTVAAGGHWVC